MFESSIFNRTLLASSSSFPLLLKAGVTLLSGSTFVILREAVESRRHTSISVSRTTPGFDFSNHQKDLTGPAKPAHAGAPLPSGSTDGRRAKYSSARWQKSSWSARMQQMKARNVRWLLRPMQLATTGQWWSNSCTHLHQP